MHEDYDYPDAYAPDPRASQRVAAQRRAQPGRSTHATEPITPLKLPTARRYVPFGIGALVLIALTIGAASYQLAQLGSAQPLAVTMGPSTAAFLGTPAQVFETPAVAAQDGSGQAIAPTPAPRTIGAYAAPDGVLLGQIEDDRMIVPVAHYGSGWVQADVAGSGLVWLRKGDVPDIALTGPDLAPVAAQTGRGPNITTTEWTPPDDTPEPQAPPPLDPTATPAPDWPTAAPASAPDFDKPDIKQTCQFIDCLGQKAVDLERAQFCHAIYWQYGNADPETIPEPDYSAVRACIWEGLYR